MLLVPLRKSELRPLIEDSLLPRPDEVTLRKHGDVWAHTTKPMLRTAQWVVLAWQQAPTSLAWQLLLGMGSWIDLLGIADWIGLLGTSD